MSSRSLKNNGVAYKRDVRNGVTLEYTSFTERVEFTERARMHAIGIESMQRPSKAPKDCTVCAIFWKEPFTRTVFQSRNPGIITDQIPGFRDWK